MERAERYMQEALELARAAGARGDVPVGCVVVCDGRIVGRGANRREQDCDVTAHAEILALREACRKLGRWKLQDCTLVVTLEPCPMCAGAILNARVGTLIFGARDPGYGAVGGVMNLLEENFRHHVRVYGGVLEQPCAAVLAGFFEGLRQEESV